MMNQVLLFVLLSVGAYRTIEACKTTTPIHCQWNSWVIGECSATCGEGTRTNTRAKKVVEKDGGTCSGLSKETLSCEEKECAIHCEWNDWVFGECSEACAGGVRTNTRDEKVSAEHGGDECHGLSSLEESCNVDECPVDCKWGEWVYGECSKECGRGTQPIFRIKNQGALFGGVECEGEATGEQECNIHPCPVDCAWNDWELGECSVICGGGTLVDTRTILTEAMHGGTPCDPESDMRVQECNTDACPPIHCQWDDWVLGECSLECGTGTQINNRLKAVEEANGGTCTGEPNETVECKIKECPIHCEWKDWVFGECSKTCGGGTTINNRTEKVSAKHGGDECDGASLVEESCNIQECPVDCTWNEWNAQDCSKTCGEGVQTKTREKMAEMFGGKPCEGESSVTDLCLDEECPADVCFSVSLTSTSYGPENSWILDKCSSTSLYASFSTAEAECCLPPGKYNLDCNDSYGDGWHGGYITINGVSYCGSFTSGSSETHEVLVGGDAESDDPYKCYHWTAGDKFNNYRDWWSDEIQRETCESYGFVFSKGDDNKAPGCGDCWCCQPVAREKECALFDDLWNVDTYKYKVPSKSFCSDYCTSIGPIDRSNPYWFECTEKTMPSVQFFMGNDQTCSVVTRNGRNDITNQDCMNQVSIYMMTGSNDATLVYLTHGFMGDGSWTETTKDVILKRYHNTSIVIGNVYWEHGARFALTTFESRSMINAMIEKPMVCCHPEILSYGRAASSTWAIGNILAYVNKEISNMATTNRFQTSCIGHSLGAHVCGFFGKMVKMLNPSFPVNKIIGLDPAGPIFGYKDSNLYQDPELRLNNGDATNVEIFHTSTDVLGFQDPLGDLDFYINGGRIQPGCDGEDFGACSHNIAPKMFDYMNKNNVSCSSKWKCNIADGSKVENIIDENQTELNNAGCYRHTKVNLGSLDQTITNGIYWVDVDTNSKTCSTSVKRNN